MIPFSSLTQPSQAPPPVIAPNSAFNELEATSTAQEPPQPQPTSAKRVIRLQRETTGKFGVPSCRGGRVVRREGGREMAKEMVGCWRVEDRQDAVVSIQWSRLEREKVR